MATTEQLIQALVSKGYNLTDAQNAARGSNAANLAREYLGQGVTNTTVQSSVPQGAVSNAPLPTAPAGGFQQGGWYNGRQYWNGTFSQPGQIHPESNQQGAGGMVSPEINAAGDAAAGNRPGANQTYINNQYQIPGTPPSSGVATSGVPGSGASGVGESGGLSGITTVSNLNLMEEQQRLYEASGITQLQTTIAGIQATIDSKKAEADKRRAEVNENPFLSESSRVGRIRKIDEALNDSLLTDEAKLANYNAQVTQKQNEINDKLNLTIKQFDIDKATRAENRDLFNSLLASGALNNASMQDLGNLAAQTGLPISFIQSAIKASQKADVQIETQTDNNGNVTILTIDKQTGQIINQVSAGRVGKGQTGSASDTKNGNKTIINSVLSSNANSWGHVDPQTFADARSAYIDAGLGSSADFNKEYAQMTDPNRGDFDTSYGFDKKLREKWTTGSTSSGDDLKDAIKAAVNS